MVLMVCGVPQLGLSRDTFYFGERQEKIESCFHDMWDPAFQNLILRLKLRTNHSVLQILPWLISARVSQLIATEVVVIRTTFALWVEERKDSLVFVWARRQSEAVTARCEFSHSPIHPINIINPGSQLRQLICKYSYLFDDQAYIETERLP